jgi:hypothetical protein
MHLIYKLIKYWNIENFSLEINRFVNGSSPQCSLTKYMDNKDLLIEVHHNAY